jgi:hypothetical protein
VEHESDSFASKAMLKVLARAGLLVGMLATADCARADSGAPGDEAARTAARALGTSGIRAYLEGNAALARERLERSYELYPTPTLGLWSARALVKLGLLVEAAERYAQVALLSVEVGDVAIQVAARDTAARERLELMPRIPSVRLTILGAPGGPATVTLDGLPVDAARLVEEIPLNPGEHEVVAQGDRARVSKAIALQEGQHETLELTFAAPPSSSPALTALQPLPAASLTPTSPAPAPPAPAPPAPAPLSQRPVPSAQPLQQGLEPNGNHVLRTAGWVSVGVGSAALATALVTYFVGLSKHEELAADDRCENDMCDPEVRDEVDRYSTLRTVNIASWIGAGAFGAAGVTLLLLSRGPGGDVKVTATGSSLALHGTF